jgi:hypothetical protein
MAKVVGLGLSIALLLIACGEDPDGAGPTDANGSMMLPTGAPMMPTATTTMPTSAGMPAAPMQPAGTGGMMPPQAAGTGAMTTAPGGCEVADAGMTPADLHAAAVQLLTAESPCGFMSCHTGRGKAGLILTGMTDLRTGLVGTASCEAPVIPLVAGGGGQAALDNSWIWLKLVAPIEAASTALTQKSAYGTSGSCGQSPAEPFGVRMPQGETAFLETERLAVIRNWICAGAPGP